MKKKELNDIKTKTIDEIKSLVAEKKEAFFKARLDKTQFKLKDTSALRRIKDDIARILTIQREKEIAQ